MIAEYSVCRVLAAKLLGAKLLKAYTLRDKQCGVCGMSVIEYG